MLCYFFYCVYIFLKKQPHPVLTRLTEPMTGGRATHDPSPTEISSGRASAGCTRTAAVLYSVVLALGSSLKSAASHGKLANCHITKMANPIERFLAPLPSPSTSTSRPSSAMSEEDEQDQAIQDSQPSAGGDLEQPRVLYYIRSFYGPSQEKGKLLCKVASCRQVICYSAGKSNYNLKNHYQNKHPKRIPDLVAALKEASRRGKHPSVSR